MAGFLLKLLGIRHGAGQGLCPHEVPSLRGAVVSAILRVEERVGPCATAGGHGQALLSYR